MLLFAVKFCRQVSAHLNTQCCCSSTAINEPFSADDLLRCWFLSRTLQRTDSLYSDLRALNIRRCSMCIVMETNELTSIDDKLVDTSTIQTTMSIYSLLNIGSRVDDGRTEGRVVPKGLLSQGVWHCHIIYAHARTHEQPFSFTSVSAV